MEPLLLSFDGEPRGKGRPRASARGGYATVYTDPKTRSYEASVAKVARVFMGERAPLIGALGGVIRFRLAIPPSTPKWLTRKYLSGESAYFGAFDVDNLAKSILDGMNGVVFADDRQFVRLFITKVAAEAPGVDVRIEALEPQPADSGH